MKAQLPLFVLDVQGGTIDMLGDVEELTYYEYYDVVDGNLLVWDRDGTRVPFKDTSSPPILSFEFDLDPGESEQIGKAQMIAWAKVHGVSELPAAATLVQIFELVRNSQRSSTTRPSLY